MLNYINYRVAVLGVAEINDIDIVPRKVQEDLAQFFVIFKRSFNTLNKERRSLIRFRYPTVQYIFSASYLIKNPNLMASGILKYKSVIPVMYGLLGLMEEIQATNSGKLNETILWKFAEDIRLMSMWKNSETIQSKLLPIVTRDTSNIIWQSMMEIMSVGVPKNLERSFKVLASSLRKIRVSSENDIALFIYLQYWYSDRIRIEEVIFQNLGIKNSDYIQILGMLCKYPTIKVSITSKSKINKNVKRLLQALKECSIYDENKMVTVGLLERKDKTDYSTILNGITKYKGFTLTTKFHSDNATITVVQEIKKILRSNLCHDDFRLSKLVLNFTSTRLPRMYYNHLADIALNIKMVEIDYKELDQSIVEADVHHFKRMLPNAVNIHKAEIRCRTIKLDTILFKGKEIKFDGNNLPSVWSRVFNIRTIFFLYLGLMVSLFFILN